MNKLVELMLSRRGLTAASYAAMDAPLDVAVEGEAAVVERLHVIKTEGRKIVVLPDFDMDGIMSGVVGLAGLSQLGFDVELYVPHLPHRYGIDATDIDLVHAMWPTATAVITCDQGIGCVEAANRCVELGIEYICTDHHSENFHSSVRGIASAIADPSSVGEVDRRDEAGAPAICGATVLWRVLALYAELWGTLENRADIARLRLFAGIGTVSDAMPLVHDNRQLVRDAITLLRLCYMNGDRWLIDSLTGHPAYIQAFAGAHAAMKALADAGKISSADDIDEGTIGFYLAPAFNSVKRMDGDLSRAFGVFLGFNGEEDMQYLLDLNAERREKSQEAWDELLCTGGPYQPFASLTEAPSGLLGLLAGRMLEQTGEPCVVVREDPKTGELSGSGRSPFWYPFLTRNVGQKWVCAGHEAAFGITFENREQMHEFFDFIREDVAAVKACAKAEGVSLEPEVDLTMSTKNGVGDIGCDLFTLADFCEGLEELRPFGKGFPEPSVKVIFDAGEAKKLRMGSEKQHGKLLLPGGVACISWNAGDAVENLPNGDTAITGKLSINSWNGRHSLQLIGNLA